MYIKEINMKELNPPSTTFTVTRIKIDDLNWLRIRATSHHRSVSQEISFIREILTSAPVSSPDQDDDKPFDAERDE